MSVNLERNGKGSNAIRRTLSIAAVIALIGGAQLPLSAQDVRAMPVDQSDARPATLPGARRHLIHARNIDETYQIDVLPVISPIQPPSPGERLPVVFVLDGNTFFPTAVTSALLQSLEAGRSMILVGVGYDIPHNDFFFLEILTRRNRDFTPTVDEAFLAQMNAMFQGFGGTYPESGLPGGAGAFLTFLNDELKPFISEEYPIADMEDLTLVGDSFGGLFALYTLFTSPESFDRYVAASPSLGWDEGVLFEQEAAFDGAQARLFMSVGSLEPKEELARHVHTMDERLDAGSYPDLRYSFHVFEGETHASVVPAAISRGLREVFE